MAGQLREVGTPTPFRDQLRQLIDERELTLRELEARTKEVTGSKGISNPAISMLLTGRLAPTIATIEILAAALGLDPAVFAEYRMALLRRSLDPGVVGFDRALAILERIEQTVDVEAGG